MVEPCRDITLKRKGLEGLESHEKTRNHYYLSKTKKRNIYLRESAYLIKKY